MTDCWKECRCSYPHNPFVYAVTLAFGIYFGLEYCGVEPEAEAVLHLQYYVKKGLNLKSLSPDSHK